MHRIPDVRKGTKVMFGFNRGRALLEGAWEQGRAVWLVQPCSSL